MISVILSVYVSVCVSVCSGFKFSTTKARNFNERTQIHLPLTIKIIVSRMIQNVKKYFV